MRFSVLSLAVLVAVSSSTVAGTAHADPPEKPSWSKVAGIALVTAGAVTATGGMLWSFSGTRLNLGLGQGHDCDDSDPDPAAQVVRSMCLAEASRKEADRRADDARQRQGVVVMGVGASVVALGVILLVVDFIKYSRH